MLTYIFLHGGLFHLLSNMFYLWLLGCNIEDAWGRRNFLIFYFGSGIAAALMHKIMHPESGIPCVGASGAIAGVMGAFMIRNYRVRIRFLFLLFFPFLHTTFFQIPAGIVLFFWFLQQLLYALVTHHTVAGVAFWAHIGGFVLGATVGSILKFGKLEEKYIKPEILKEEARLYENPEILQAQKLLESGRYQEAEEILRKLLSREPQHIEARSVLVNIYLWGKAPIDQIRREINLLFKNYIEKNAKTTALLKYSELVKQLPNLVLSPEVHFFVARAAEEAGNNNLALSLYNGLIATYPNAPQTWKAFFNKGLVLEKLSRLNEAIKVFEELLTRYPEHEWRGLVEDKIKELKAQF
jgi:membrane associated rhomboid family serine protease